MSVVWLFDMDDTLHDASWRVFPQMNIEMTQYIVRHLGVDEATAGRLRVDFWRRYGATLLGLVRHHGVRAHHFLHHTHLLPGLEERVRGHAHDFAAIARLRGTKIILTNAPAAYAERVLGALGVRQLFDAVIPIERMQMFGELRPKPDARMLRRIAVRLGVALSRCVLVEDTPGHLKAARSVGMGTVWMQRWTRGAAARGGPSGATRTSMTPAYVDRRVHNLRGLAAHAAHGLPASE